MTNSGFVESITLVSRDQRLLLSFLIARFVQNKGWQMHNDFHATELTFKSRKEPNLEPGR